MSFHENATFPTKIAWGSRVGPGFRTIAVEGDAGSSERAKTWPLFRRRWNVKYGIRSLADLIEVYNFAIIRDGPVHGFRMSCPLDFSSATDHRSAPAFGNQVIGTYDGSTLQFPLIKTYTDASSFSVVKPITKPRPGSVLIGVNGSNSTNFTVDTGSGVVTLTVAPTVGHVITAGYLYDCAAQFDPELDEEMEIGIEGFEAAQIPNIFINEMLGDVTSPEPYYHGDAQILAVTSGGIHQISSGSPKAIILTGPTSASATLLMPNPNNLELGADYFHIANAIAGTPTITVRNHLNSLTVTTLGAAANAIMVVYLSGVTKFWGAFKNA